MYKIIGADGKEYGPIPADVLRQWIAEGRADARTRILLEGTTEWKALAEFPEFGLASVGTAAPPPSLAVASPAAADAVNGPAVGLMVTAILGFVLQATGLVFRLVGTSVMAMQRDMPGWVTMLSGTLGVVAGIIGILVSLLIFIGALKMKNLQNYALAMAASIISMIPCISPCCLLGLPFGIWALVVLSKPEVKSAFH